LNIPPPPRAQNQEGEFEIRVAIIRICTKLLNVAMSLFIRWRLGKLASSLGASRWIANYMLNSMHKTFSTGPESSVLWGCCRSSSRLGTTWHGTSPSTRNQPRIWSRLSRSSATRSGASFLPPRLPGDKVISSNIPTHCT